MLAVCALTSAAGCEGAPARPKHWRHAPDPEAAARTAGPSGDAARRAADRAEADARRDRTLRIRLVVAPSHLNPLVDPEREGLQVVEDTVFESLIRYDGAAYSPGLAESWSIVQGGREIRFILRPGVTFHDGKPFTAVDAQWSLDQARQTGSRATHLREALADVQGVEMWGPRDLRIVLSRPNAYVLRALAWAPMLPAHIYGSGGDLARHPKNRAPIGTGPYVFSSWDHGDEERIILARSDTYWGDRPAIEQVDFVIEPDAAAALLAAKQGEIDVIPSLIPEYFASQAGAPALVAGFKTLELAPPRFRFVVVNTATPPFDDVRVREAAALLIDRDKIAANLFRGLAQPIAGPVWSGGPVDGEAVPAPRHDPARAYALLEAAGWKDTEGDGKRERNGEALRVTLLATVEARGDEERDLIVTAWRNAGFVVELLPGDPRPILNRLRAHTFHAGLIEWRGRSDEDLSPLLATRGELNWGQFTSRSVDGVLEAMRGAWEPAGRQVRAGELARLLVTEWPLLPLTAPAPRGLVHQRVDGLVVRDGWFAIRRCRLIPAQRGD